MVQWFLLTQKPLILSISHVPYCSALHASDGSDRWSKFMQKLKVDQNAVGVDTSTVYTFKVVISVQSVFIMQ